MVVLALIAVILGLAVSTAAAQKPDTKAEAQALLNRAADAVHALSRDNTPFELHGRFRLGSSSKQRVEGTYALFWVSTDKWREEIIVRGVRRLRVGEEGRYWQVQELRGELASIHDAAALLDVRRQIKRLQADEIHGLSRKKKKGRELLCIKTLSELRGEIETCLDATQHVPVSDTWQAFSWGSSEYEFRTVGSKWFPQLIRKKIGGKTEAEFFLDEVREAPSFSNSLFDRPEGAEGWPTCDTPQPSLPIASGGSTSRDLPPEHGKMVLYGIVGSDGKLRNLQVLHSMFKNPLQDMVERLSQTRYHPARCNGRPVDSELITRIEVSSGLGAFRKLP
jgi:hypothetical protein